MICHLTHRCHNRAFLFKFARDRSEYRERLRLVSRYFGVSLLNYSLTSNHTHEAVIESRTGGICGMMQKLEGDFAGFYNRRKRRSGSFWEDRYHCTTVEDGEHPWNCIQYVDLNMVRAGVVSHPRDWGWYGFLLIVAHYPAAGLSTGNSGPRAEINITPYQKPNSEAFSPVRGIALVA